MSDDTVREVIKQLPAILAAGALVVTAFNSSQKSETIRDQAKEIIADGSTITNLIEQVKSVSQIEQGGEFE